jgi:hypothetical protein
MSIIKTVQRLEFENVFPEEKPNTVLEYLKLVSAPTLLGIIGFNNIVPV